MGVKVVGLDHVQLAMPAGGEAEARRFYGELLGLLEIPKPEGLAGRGGCWFEGPGLQIHLGVEADFRPARKAHPALLASNLEHLRTALEEAQVVTMPDASLTGVRRFYASDPFGNRIEFIQEGEGFLMSGR